MTNLSDLLNDFAEDVRKISEPNENNAMDWEDNKKNLIEDLLKVIKERLIGE